MSTDTLTIMADVCPMKDVAGLRVTPCGPRDRVYVQAINAHGIAIASTGPLDERTAEAALKTAEEAWRVWREGKIRDWSGFSIHVDEIVKVRHESPDSPDVLIYLEAGGVLDISGIRCQSGAVATHLYNQIEAWRRCYA